MNRLGQILEFELNTGRQHLRAYPETRVREVLAGRGFNVRHLYRHLAPGTDPLGAANRLVISGGLLTGTSAPASSRLHLNALSPLTGLLGSANIGGGFGRRLCANGFQAVILRGRAPRPSILVVEPSGAHLEPADDLWGLDTWETETRLRERFADTDPKVLTIGPAGEKRVRFACIVSERDHAAGRTGLGAVMGAKNLKAIVLPRPPASRKRRSSAGGDAVREYSRRIRASEDFETFSRYGGAGYLEWCNQMGIMGTRNYRQNRFDGTGRLDGRRLAARVSRRRGCAGCPVQCKAELRFDSGPLAGRTAHRPEFEPMINLGARCGLDDAETLVRLDNLCSRLGLDSTSTGAVLSFAMDLFDRGVLTAEETDGLDLRWGSGAGMEALIRAIAARDGFGNLLAGGVRRAAERIGRGAQRRAAHVKGLELTAYDPRGILGTALGYMVSSRGGDYNNVYAALEHRWSPQKAAAEFGTSQAVNLSAPEGKGRLVRRAVLVNVVVDSLGLCKVPALSLIGTFDLQPEARLVGELTGLEIDARWLFVAGERISAMERLINIRFGAGWEDDRLPEMFVRGSNDDGGIPGDDLARMRQDFYTAMGWDAEGRPLPSTLARLGLLPVHVPVEAHTRTKGAMACTTLRGSDRP